MFMVCQRGLWLHKILHILHSEKIQNLKAQRLRFSSILQIFNPRFLIPM